MLTNSVLKYGSIAEIKKNTNIFSHFKDHKIRHNRIVGIPAFNSYTNYFFFAH